MQHAVLEKIGDLIPVYIKDGPGKLVARIGLGFSDTSESADVSSNVPVSVIMGIVELILPFYFITGDFIDKSRF